jgi:hypothetical protein
MGENEPMKKLIRVNVYLVMVLVLLASFALPQSNASASSKTKIHLYIQGASLDKSDKVTLVYTVKEKKKDKYQYHEKQLNFSRHNSTLYLASKPDRFEASKNVTFKVKRDGKTENYKPFKVSSHKGTVYYWITVKKKAQDPKPITTFTHNEPIIPTVKDVYSNGDGTFTVYWGYENNNDVTVDALDSRFTNVVHVYNKATPLKKGFAEGKVEEAFKTVFAGKSIVWELTGPDKVKRKAIAYASNAKAYHTLQPLLKGVYKNIYGTYTAYWGYHNGNTVSVDSKSSQYQTPALNNQLPMKANFAPGIVAEAFKTTFNSATLSWNLVGPNGASSTVTADALQAKAYVGVTPTVKAVHDNANGTFTAYFGYQNQNDVAVDALESKFISGTVLNNKQPKKTDFLVGINDEVFSIVFKGTELTWELTGPDGQKRIVKATSTNAPKYTALLPTVNKVINNGNGTFTAVWGYHNQNAVAVNALGSTFKGNVLKNETAKKENFKVGLQVNTFETTFKGTELSWNVKGPDGVTRTITAYAKDAVVK